jgi:ABC-2 type transport system permease protein
LVRYVTKLLRNPTLLGTSLAMPLIFLVLFSQLFQKLSVFLPNVSGGYLPYLLPGIVSIGALVSSPQSGVSIVNDLNSGFLSEMLLTSVRRPAILLGRLLADMLVVVAQCTIVIIAAIGMGVRIYYGLLGVLLILLTVAFLEFALSGIFLAVGMATRRTETINAVAGLIGLPLMFVSSAMFPISFLPSWAQIFSSINPLSYSGDAMRQLVLGGFKLSALLDAYTFTGAIAIATIAATIYQFRKVIT